MSFIREPKWVDFVIQSTPLTDEERNEISAFIKNSKLKKLLEQNSKLKTKRLLHSKIKTK
jgi:hypothetical protein